MAHSEVRIPPKLLNGHPAPEAFPAILAQHRAERKQRTLEAAFAHMESLYRQCGEPKQYGWIQARCPLVDSIYILMLLPSSTSCA